jgi:hypothetical protein
MEYDVHVKTKTRKLFMIKILMVLTVLMAPSVFSNMPGQNAGGLEDKKGGKGAGGYGGMYREGISIDMTADA